MSSHKYPRIGGKEHRPKNTSAVCTICGEVAKWRVEVQVNIFRGDDEVEWCCEKHKADAGAIVVASSTMS